MYADLHNLIYKNKTFFYIFFDWCTYSGEDKNNQNYFSLTFRLIDIERKLFTTKLQINSSFFLDNRQKNGGGGKVDFPSRLFE